MSCQAVDFLVNEVLWAVFEFSYKMSAAAGSRYFGVDGVLVAIDPSGDKEKAYCWSGCLCPKIFCQDPLIVVFAVSANCFLGEAQYIVYCPICPDTRFWWFFGPILSGGKNTEGGIFSIAAESGAANLRKFVYQKGLSICESSLKFCGLACRYQHCEAALGPRRDLWDIQDIVVGDLGRKDGFFGLGPCSKGSSNDRMFQ